MDYAGLAVVVIELLLNRTDFYSFLHRLNYFNVTRKLMYLLLKRCVRFSQFFSHFFLCFKLSCHFQFSPTSISQVGLPLFQHLLLLVRSLDHVHVA